MTRTKFGAAAQKVNKNQGGDMSQAGLRVEDGEVQTETEATQSDSCCRKKSREG